MTQDRDKPDQRPILSHIRLMEIGREFGYRDMKEGICFGVANMAMQAALIGDLESYTNRLDRLSNLSPEFIKKLKEKLDNLDKNAKQEFTQEEIDVMAFFDGISIYQSLSRELSGKRNYGQDTLASAPFAASVKLNEIYKKWQNETPPPAKQNDAGPISRITKYSCAYNKKDLARSLELLAMKLNSEPECDVPFTMILNGPDHSVSVSYLPDSTTWMFVDANNLPPQMYISSLEESLLAENICKSLFSPDTTIIATDIIVATPYRDKVKDYIEKWRKMDEMVTIHKVTPEKTAMHDHRGAHWLNIAIKEGIVDDISKIIFSGNVADLNNYDDADKDGFSLLALAVNINRLDLVKAILSSGYDINKRGVPGNNLTALHVAAANNNVKLIEYLLASGADPSVWNNGTGRSPMMEAAHHGQLDIVMEMYARIEDEYKPLHLVKSAFEAAMSGHVQVLAFLLDAGVSPDQSSDDKTLLETAVEHNQTDIVMLLHERRAKPATADTQNKTDQTNVATITDFWKAKSINDDALDKLDKQIDNEKKRKLT